MNDFVEWVDAYSVGNPLLDEQHKRLFELANEVWAARKEPDEEKRRLFKKVLDELKAHCLDEERILEQNRCPTVESHKQAHGEILEQVGEILDSFEDRNSRTWYRMMVFLMEEFFLKHLIEVDLECKSYLEQK